MPNLSLRGLDDATLARLKALARTRGISVNRLIVETLQREYRGKRRFDDIEHLLGKWSAKDAEAFERAVAGFGDIEPGLWANEPPATYSAKRATRRARRR